MKTFELLSRSLEKNELPKFLMGTGEYHINDKWVELPTDLSEIFLHGFNKYVETHKKDTVFLNDKISEALLELLKQPIGTWWCISIIYSYLFGYQKDALLFNIETQELSKTVNESVKRFSASLENEKAWVGWRFPNGLVDDLQNKIKKINSLFSEFENLN